MTYVKSAAFEPEVRFSAKAKKIGLRAQPRPPQITLTFPAHIDRRSAAEFVARQSEWLMERWLELPPAIAIRPGAIVPFEGRDIVVERGGRRTELIEHDDGETLFVSGPQRMLPRRVAAFMRAQAQTRLAPAVHRHARATGRAVRSLRLNDAQRAWGTADRQGNLVFSWRLIMAPPAVLNYVVAHEVAHLTHHNHGDRFWALCRQLCPQANTMQTWLERYGPHLQAMDFRCPAKR